MQVQSFFILENMHAAIGLNFQLGDEPIAALMQVKYNMVEQFGMLPFSARNRGPFPYYSLQPMQKWTAFKGTF
jgi:hypothetical protein